ncbi:MAG: pteridine reductase [Cycloclasticus sp. symbiont of Poecilosclerida sp. M]|nr:MAG: pteridine reductase [Cycloclasticus sp. symbiont of Poecilosclerida sp. M]
MVNQQKCVLITGAARRIGAEISRAFHAAGFTVIVHYLKSAEEAEGLVDSFNQQRPNSAWAINADLSSIEQIRKLVDKVSERYGGLDVLVNNASSFYPTPVGQTTETQWDELMASNLKASFFLSQATKNLLAKRAGCIVNMVDIYAQKALPEYLVYSVAKSGLQSLTRGLAKELAPNIRVNGVAPGIVLWPENNATEDNDRMIERVPLKKKGVPSDIAKTVLFLAQDAPYITGQVIAVDGGKSLV